MKHILLCPPTYYDIRYEINPWMHEDNPVDKHKAREQYETLKYALEQLNVPYDELPPDPDLPDQVFTTDIGHAEGNQFIKANFKYPERTREAEIAADYFKKKNYTIHELPEGVYFEGGDFLKCGNTYFFGWGKRSSKEAIEHLQQYVQGKIIPIELPDEYYYHLDTCFAPLSPEVALVHEKALTDEGRATIRKHFKTIIPTSDEDNVLLACNLLALDDTTILTQGISNTLKDTLRPHGFLVSTVPMSEYIKGGGSVHCISFEIFE